MLLPMGILASSGGATADYELISTQVLGSSSASVTFSSIPSGFKHIQLRVVSRDTSGTAGAYRFQINGDTGSNYANHYVRGNGSTVLSNSNAPANYGLDNVVQPYAGSQSDAYGVLIADFLDYSQTTKYKTIRGLSGTVATGANDVRLQSAVWMSTSAITSLSILDGWTAFTAGSRFSLYGLKG